ncbi:zinc-dependent alcohol dehydrogenase [Spirillospora sp. NBC_01491]|uniref:zinc-dependent alcohol dehydrogenase n=1 Tax=Spirillospora sp. NBC_01491 TaxID=2976007 RepID=UPI002E340D31|nr:alcohol dehydrogenase catalytic domain-containing protein [Spirillospora sp. NBC_01491]
MRAARWHGPGDVRVVDVPAPEPGPGEVLVEVELCGLCGTDVEMSRDGAPGAGPLTLGHEVVGVVAAHGPGAADDAPPAGTRVIPDVVLGCGACWWCARHQEGLCERQLVRGMGVDGGMATWMVADAATCVPVPSLPPEVAVFAEPVSVAVRALRKAGDVTGGTALIHGAGTIGVLLAQVARAVGLCAVVAEPAAGRRDVAARAGALAVEPAEAAATVAGLTAGRGPDVVFECSGVPRLLGEAVRRCRRGGTVVAVGFGSGPAELPVDALVLGEKRLLGTAAHVWDEDITAAVRLLESGIVDVTAIPMRVAALEEVPRLLAAPDPAVLKTAVRPDAASAPPDEQEDA